MQIVVCKSSKGSWGLFDLVLNFMVNVAVLREDTAQVLERWDSFKWFMRASPGSPVTDHLHLGNSNRQPHPSIGHDCHSKDELEVLWGLGHQCTAAQGKQSLASAVQRLVPCSAPPIVSVSRTSLMSERHTKMASIRWSVFGTSVYSPFSFRLFFCWNRVLGRAGLCFFAVLGGRYQIKKVYLTRNRYVL